MLQRRQFLKAATTGFSLGPFIGRPRDVSKQDSPETNRHADPGDAQTVTLIAYNIYGGTGWPRNRPRAKKMVELKQFASRLAAELALDAPDIVTFSESPSEAITKQVAEALGMHHVRFPSGGQWPGTLLSRFPIVESANVPLPGGRPKDLFTRHWGRAVVQLDDQTSWIIHSAHLFPTADPEVRLREIDAMLETMKTDLVDERPMVLMGDLNHGPDTAEYRKWIDAGWRDTFSQQNPQDEGRTIPADNPKWRIDYVLVSPPLATQVTESRPLFEGCYRLNVDDSQSFALSDHLPQLARILRRS